MDNTLFSSSMMLVDKLMPHVSADNLQDKTPCSEWDVEMLTNHLINELAWIKPLVEGKTIAEVGEALDGDLIKGDAAGSWLKYCEEVSGALVHADPKADAHLSYGDKPNQAYVDEVAADIIVHGWDLAQAIGQDYTVDDKTVDAVLAVTKDIMPMARESGYVGPEVTAAENSSKMDKMLAAYGRKPGWK